jgi:hypothetical protein
MDEAPPSYQPMSEFPTNCLLRLRYYCRALHVIAIQRLEVPETHVPQFIIIASIRHHHHGQQIVAIPLTPGYTYDTVLIQPITSEGRDFGEPIQLSFLDGMPTGTMAEAKIRRRSM